MQHLLIQLIAISKTFATRSLFDALTFSVHAGDCIALVGANGTGKTSLLKILGGILEPDSGTLEKKESLTVDYLPQEVAADTGPLTVREYLEEGPLTKLSEEMERCLEDPDRLEEWERLHELFEKQGGYCRQPLESVLDGLHIDLDLLERPFSTLSGGQRVRVALAKTLRGDPDLLLLDEPTNHLDPASTDWLRKRLKTRRGATIVVSHDRSFLNEACNRLAELEEGRLISYSGTYDDYLEEKERRLQQKIKAYEEQEEERKALIREIKAVTFSSPKATPPKDSNKMGYDHRGGNFQKSQQRNISMLKGKLQAIEESPMKHPRPKGITGLYFEPCCLKSEVALEFSAISKTFEGREVFKDFSGTLVRKGRVLMQGPNGSGKTTLLKMAAGELLPDDGAVYFSSGSKIAYLDQEAERIPLHETPAAYFQKCFRLDEEGLLRELGKADLGGFELIRRPFYTLSVGQRKRMMLLSLILERPNILLLDEPTNHLDLKTLEALEKALLAFEGALLAVSHDATFIKKIALETWRLT
ncbi:ribosomal protection-like ABC-F family protein [Estrella lausannensis]|uniref:ABC-type transporter, ATPase subunit n=1 Tax=Estrella lausannensis TaxID=483423 RepID=A0A0H5DQ74_9BACT|nr:ABC-F family ATP-binding cassette domain-containing protein [Estrella lausannensis]CRX37684.1 ABC-type transporter, ATPase subunit [Estrella lausannensis]